MGQNTALKTRRLKKRGQPQRKKRSRKDKAQGTKGRFQQKSCTKHQKGWKYICKIYMKKRIYVYIYQGVIYLTLGVLPTFLET